MPGRREKERADDGTGNSPMYGRPFTCDARARRGTDDAERLL
jgi:hypothetical protein